MKNPKLFCYMAILAGAVFLLASSAQAELLAYFPFDDNSPNDVVHGLTATVNGAPTYVTGVFGDAISFDGVDDYLDVVDDPGNDVLEAIDGVISSTTSLEGTIMMWVKTTATSGNDGSTAPTFIERRQPGSTYKMMYKLNLGADEDFVNLTYPGPAYAITNTTISDGTWHHIAVSVKRSADNTKSYLYAFVDGYQKGIATLPEGFDSTLCEDLHIGAREKNTGEAANFIETDIDELAIFSQYMTGADIREIIANGVPIPEPGTFVLLIMGLCSVLLTRKR